MAESRSEKDIDADVEEAMKKYFKKMIREILRCDDRLSTIRIVYYILTK